METKLENNSLSRDRENILPEHKPVIYDQYYHGSKIRIIEFDHHDSEQAGVEYKLPENWKQTIKEQIEATSGPIAPEYCIPDLEKYLFNTNGPVGYFLNAVLGGPAKDVLMPPDDKSRKTNDGDSQIVPFYGFISKMAGFMQRKLIATDTANKAVYRIFADMSMVKHQSNENARNFNGVGVKFIYDYGKIDPSEYQRQDSNDGRHLISARGLMQESLRSGEKQITAIWAPKHAERIADYIKRQADFEANVDSDLRHPVEFKDVSPPEEKQKMVFYGRPPLMRSVREYRPVLSPAAYEIDLLANQDVLNAETLKVKMKEYLSINPQGSREEKYYTRVRRALKKLEKGKVFNIKGILNTDKMGWMQLKKEYIY